MMILLQDVAYAHPNRDELFSNINLSVQTKEKLGLIGHNGTGKSTLLKVIAGRLPVTQGSVKTSSLPYYLPQQWTSFRGRTIADALQVAPKLTALQEILAGRVTEENFTALDDDWTIEERCKQALAGWKLDQFDPAQPFDSLSGGEKTKLFMAGIEIHRPEIVLLDEPSNHLDAEGRAMLYRYIETTENTLVVVSHDRHLLGMLPALHELSRRGLNAYGGNYVFYEQQKQLEEQALKQDVKEKEKALRKASQVEREARERQQKLDARGKKKQEKAGLPTISMNTFRNNAEKTAARLKETHHGKQEHIRKELDQLRHELPDDGKMRVSFDQSALHKGKILATAERLNLVFNNRQLWKEGLDFQIRSGERIALKGANGSGKTSLLRMILGQLPPSAGKLETAIGSGIYIDQDYSWIQDELSVYELAQRSNNGQWQEHEIKILLTRFLFTDSSWDRPCRTLSGGEKMRLMLCTLSIGQQAPDVIVLDEPTNNLDIQNVEILARAVNEYRGTLIIVSHDEIFLKEVGADREIILNAG